MLRGTDNPGLSGMRRVNANVLCILMLMAMAQGQGGADPAKAWFQKHCTEVENSSGMALAVLVVIHMAPK